MKHVTPSMRKNVFDCVGFPWSPPECLIISALFLSTKFDSYHKQHFMRIFCLCFHLSQRRLAALSVWSLSRNVSRFQPGGQTCKGIKKKKKSPSALLNFLVKLLVVTNLSWWPKIPQVLVFSRGKAQKPAQVIALIPSESTPAAQSSPVYSSSLTPSQFHFPVPHVAFKGSRDQSSIEGFLVPVCGCQHSIQK